LNAWEDELTDCQLDARYGALAEQAASNASRILAPDPAMLRRVMEAFDIEAHRVVVMSEDMRRQGAGDSRASRAAAAAELTTLYQAVLDERFGGAS
jgi:hypothetical protein